MSKIIKSNETDARLKVRRFEKTAFSISSPENPSQSAGEPAPAESQPAGSVERKDPVAEAQEQAERLLSITRKEAEDIRREAHQQGYSDGLTKAHEEKEEAIAEIAKASTKLLDSLLNQFKAQESEMMRLLSPRVADLATELARKIIHREINQNPDIVTAQAEEAIKRLLERDKLIIRVHPTDEKRMKDHKPVLMSMFDGIDKIEVIADPAVEQGGCVIETHLVKMDAQPQSQLQAARKALTPESEK